MLTVFLEECCAASFFFIKNSWPTVVVVSNPMIKAGFKSPNPGRASHAASCPAVDGEHLWLCCAQPTETFSSSSFCSMGRRFLFHQCLRACFTFPSGDLGMAWAEQCRSTARQGRQVWVVTQWSLGQKPRGRNFNPDLAVCVGFFPFCRRYP